MEFCYDRKSQGILPKILEKSEKDIPKFFFKYWKSLSASNSENPTNITPYFK